MNKNQTNKERKPKPAVLNVRCAKIKSTQCPQYSITSVLSNNYFRKYNKNYCLLSHFSFS